MKVHATLRVLVAALAAMFLVLVSVRARAEFVPPPFTSSVVDQAGKLSEGERTYLTGKIEQKRRATGFVVAVFLPASLDGEAIEDVAYKTARAWQVGDKGKDNGVLLVIATTERKVRIETGKGTGGALTDLQANIIIRERVGPLLKQERFRDGVEAGIDGIYGALAKDPAAGPRAKKPTTGPAGAFSGVSLMVVLIPVVLFFILFSIVMRIANRRAARARGHGQGPDDHNDGGGGVGGGPIIFMGGGGWGGGGGGDGGGGGNGGDGGGNSDWGGGGGDDYGGGGDFGGGGSGDDY